MAKLLEKNGMEMSVALIELATPIRNFVDDDEFMTAFNDATKRGKKLNLQNLMVIYADIIPVLFGEKHLNDTMQILATIEGTTVKDMLAGNGTDMLADALKAWKEQISPFFIRLGLLGGVR